MLYNLLISSLLTTTSTSSLPLPSTSPPQQEIISWPSPANSCHGPPEPYIIRPSPGKGLGVFALHDLDIGTIIMRESPILTIARPSFKKGTGYPMAAISNLVRQEFNLLSPSSQAEILNLTFHATAAEKEKWNTEDDVLGLIFKSNAYKTDEKIGLFPKIARINHGCVPNTSYYWNAKLGKRIVFANRGIRKGEEISDSYISLLVGREERWRSLESYGFRCRCAACEGSGGGSDERRVEIKRVFGELEGQLSLPDPSSAREKTQAARNARQATRLVEMVKAEGLADYYANAYRFAAIFHSKIGEWGVATKWANMGYEWRVMEDPESGFAMEMFELTSRCIEGWKNELRDRELLKGEV